jgi:hypothetical protein
MSEHHPINALMLAEKNATGHSIWGPSSAHRWMRCRRSLIEGHLAGDRPTYYAAEGSVAHWVGETWLTAGSSRVYAELGNIHVKDGFEIEITEEMISYVEEYVEICSTDYEVERSFVEVKVDLSQYTPEPSFGTSDFIGIVPSKRLLKVKDLKYGKVWVDPDDNEQGMAYALGAFNMFDWLYDFQEIEIQIVQPRRGNYGVWTIGRDRLLEFAEEYREAAHEAWNPEADYNPDPIACEYCPARLSCPALAAVMKRIAVDSFDDDVEPISVHNAVAEIAQLEMISGPVLPAYQHVPIEKLARMYEWRPILERYFREMYDFLLRKLELGVDVPGHMLARGRPGNRAWADPVGARKMLRGRGLTDLDIYEHKMIGPATAEKLLKVSIGGTKKENAARLAPFVFQSPGKVTMVSSADARPAIASAASAFDDDVDAIE